VYPLKFFLYQTQANTDYITDKETPEKKNAGDVNKDFTDIDISCPMPNGAFYCIAQLPIDDSDVFCQWLLEKFAYQNETVMLAPATGFYSKPELGKHQVRIAYVLNQDALKRAMKCLDEALKVYPGRTLEHVEAKAMN